MKWERTDLTVGSVVLLAILILTGAFVWISPAVSSETYPVYTEYRRIDGLAEQAGVFLHGFSIGRVQSIEPALDAGGQLVFRVEMRLRRRLASGDTLVLREGTIARLSPPPVPIGGGTIVLEPPEQGGGRAILPNETIPGVRAVAMMDQMQGMTATLTGEVLQTLAVARNLMDSLTLTVGAANRTMAATTSELPELLAGIRQELEAAHALTVDVRSTIGTLTPAALASIDTAQALLTDSRALVGEINGLLRERRPELDGIIASLDTTTVILQNFMRQVAERPWKLFTGVEPPAGLGLQPATSARNEDAAPATP